MDLVIHSFCVFVIMVNKLFYLSENFAEVPHPLAQSIAIGGNTTYRCRHPTADISWRLNRELVGLQNTHTDQLN